MQVLIIDDSVALAETLRLMLDLMGHSATVCNSGGAGLVHVAGHTPDVILLDIGLPDMSGYEACKRLRETGRLSKTMIVAQTGRDHPDDIREAKEAGFDDYLVKPVPFDRLEALLNNIALQSGS